MKALLALLFALFSALAPAAFAPAERAAKTHVLDLAQPDDSDCECCEAEAGAAIACAFQCQAALTATGTMPSPTPLARSVLLFGDRAVIGLAVKPRVPPPRSFAYRQ